ncbi:MAG TPA: Maf family nucleotide pyrophosphatase [Flavobacteriales bacterium]|nr:Maf family nucleotide pyrophosphatase [Flavobacteriales bacterium]HRN36092.1 Maf family nucleotide pyrophosphatase [Flavobacteriales bacterium]HRO38906.1 Maf family nucleotide pyrophosphatase [Flavobacteriales bacterium]HRP81132.1 Maf family nucleotide pyrophosphatase [Flavobacteriales bacterium]HRQ86011.1 Maf family nucleotide pyrophosphatase [Flavobacteriales bacterium]
MNPIEPPLSWRLVLASSSPRRRHLLHGLDLPVEITKVDVDEDFPGDMPHDQVAEHLARRKARAWKGELADDQALITADTTVLLDELILNKPLDAEDAKRMLSLLSGKDHRVVTGVCIRTRTGLHSFSDTALVTFRQLDEEEIAYYVERHSPLDKAGAYGVQDWIGYTAVECIEGSFYTVMGLPMHRLYAELKLLAERSL